MPDQSATVYDVVGSEGITLLVRYFYEQIPTDDVLGTMYPRHELDQAETRLRSFLIYRLGGPADYLSERGDPRLRMRHAPFPIDQSARDRWILLMGNALEQVTFPAEIKSELRQFFEGVATFLINRPTE